jgi:hypothetical protein
MEKLTKIQPQEKSSIDDNEDATAEEVQAVSVAKSQAMLKIRQEAEDHYNEWNSNIQFVHDIPNGLSPNEYNAAKRSRMRILRCRSLGLPDDISDEELLTARKEKSKIRQRRKLGLPDDASDEEIEKARNHFDFEHLKELTEEEKESRKRIKKEFEIRADLDLPANATDEDVEYKIAVRDEEFSLGMHKVIY